MPREVYSGYSTLRVGEAGRLSPPPVSALRRRRVPAFRPAVSPENGAWNNDNGIFQTQDFAGEPFFAVLASFAAAGKNGLGKSRGAGGHRTLPCATAFALKERKIRNS